MTNKDEKRDKYLVKIASKRIEKEFDSLPQKEYNRIRIKIKALADNPRPHGVTKLTDRVHRIRIGDYRVIYSIFDKEKIVLLAKVTKRNETTYMEF